MSPFISFLYSVTHTQSHTHKSLFSLSLLLSWLTRRNDDCLPPPSLLPMNPKSSSLSVCDIIPLLVCGCCGESWWWLTWEISCWAALSRVLLDLFLSFLFLVYIFLFLELNWDFPVAFIKRKKISKGKNLVISSGLKRLLWNKGKKKKYSVVNLLICRRVAAEPVNGVSGS
jgi:hypothetical protein